MSLLDVSHLAYYYPKQAALFQDINCQLQVGQVLTILGLMGWANQHC